MSKLIIRNRIVRVDYVEIEKNKNKNKKTKQKNKKKPTTNSHKMSECSKLAQKKFETGKAIDWN